MMVWIPVNLAQPVECLNVGLIFFIQSNPTAFSDIIYISPSSNTNSKDFYILSIDIYKTLALDGKNRKDKPNIYLETKYAEYCKYKSVSS